MGQLTLLGGGFQVLWGTGVSGRENLGKGAGNLLISVTIVTMPGVLGLFSVCTQCVRVKSTGEE